MDSDEIYKIIGYTVAVIFFIYLISKAFSLNVRVIESFAGDDEEEDKKENSNISGRAIFLNNNKETEGMKDDDFYKKQINNIEKKNDKLKELLIKHKDLFRDLLSVQYNNYLYHLIVSSATMAIVLKEAKDDEDNIDGNDEESNKKRQKRIEDDKNTEEYLTKSMDAFKRIKDNMSLLDFAFNELENIN